MNLETTIHNFETYGAALSGGSWFCAEPRVLDDVKEFGFNMLTTANNHAMDYSHTGLLKTLEYLQAAGLPTCGTGRSLAEAAAPIYLDAPGGRYAVIGACSTFYPDAMAGEQTRTMPGRPGLNGLRFDTRYELPEAQLAQLREIAAALDLTPTASWNARRAIFLSCPTARRSLEPCASRAQTNRASVPA